MNKNIMLVVGILVAGVALGLFAQMKGKQDVKTMENAAPQESATEDKSASGVSMAKNAVTIEKFAFSPATLTVKVGDTVTWTNKDLTGHSATADDKSFDTGVMSQGKSVSETFDKAGTFPYHCTPHPNMKATIVVE